MIKLSARPRIKVMEDQKIPDCKPKKYNIQ